MMMMMAAAAAMEESGSAGGRPQANLDHPPNSRLFLVISKSTPEEVIREKFSFYGEVQDIWVVRDKQTKDHKGIAYVKFAKSSQACKAMEEMHGRALSEDTKAIKVFIAQSRGSGSHRDVEDEELTRIFVMIPKTYSEDDLRENFKEFGDIEYCSVIKNKNTGESKGFGYVRFLKPSQAAQAIENCERTFKAILAEPRNKQNVFSENDYMNIPRQDATVYGTGYEPSRAPNTSPFGAGEFGSFGVSDVRGGENISTCLSVTTRGVLTHEQVYSLFDLIPGLEYCEIQRDPYMGYSKGYALIRYNNVASAVYAREKLNGFEYPPGNRLGISYVEDESGDRRSNPVGMMALQLVAAQMMSMVCGSPTAQQMMPTPVSTERQVYGGSTSTTQISRLQVDFAVPPCQQFAPVESSVRERLFVVFNPTVLPLDILEDLFCRYGNLIDVYLVPGRNIGYIKFAERANAAEAMEALHGKVVNGVKLKVMLADPPREESHKRQRTH